MNHRLLPIRATAPLCIFTLRPCGPAPEVRSSTSLLLVMIRILELPGGHRRRNRGPGVARRRVGIAPPREDRVDAHDVGARSRPRRPDRGPSEGVGSEPAPLV